MVFTYGMLPCYLEKKTTSTWQNLQKQKIWKRGVGAEHRESLEWDAQKRKEILTYYIWCPTIQAHVWSHSCDCAVVCEGIWSMNDSKERTESGTTPTKNPQVFLKRLLHLVKIDTVYLHSSLYCLVNSEELSRNLERCLPNPLFIDTLLYFPDTI